MEVPLLYLQRWRIRYRFLVSLKFVLGKKIKKKPYPRNGQGILCLALILILPGCSLAQGEQESESVTSAEATGEEERKEVETVTSIEEVIKRLKPSEEELFSQAYELQKSGKHREAVPIFVDLLRYYPETKRKEESLFRMAECYWALGRAKETNGTLSLLLENYPKGKFTYPAFAMQGEILAVNKKWAEAVKPLQQALKTKNNALKARVLYLLILSAEHLNKLPDFLMELEQLTLIKEKENPYRDYARLKFGVLLEGQGQEVKALKLYKKIVSSSREAELRVEAGVRAGSIAYQKGDYRDAAGYYETVRRTESAEYWVKLAHLGLIQAHFALANYDEVVHVYNEVRPAFPEAKRAEVMFLTAEAYRLLNQGDQALPLYGFLLKEFPQHVVAEKSAWARLLILHGMQDQRFLPETARFIKAYPKSDKLFHVKLMRAEGLFAKKDYKECQPLFSELLADEKNFQSLDQKMQAGIWYEHGFASFMLEKFSEARGSLEVLVQRYADFAVMDHVLWLLGQAYQEEQQPMKALGVWSRLVREYKDFDQREVALWKTGLLAGTQEDYQAMREFLEELLLIYPETKQKGEAIYWLAISLEQAGEKMAALDYWRQAREVAPKKYFEEATQRLLRAALASKDLPSLIEEVENYEQWSETHKKAVAISADVYEWIGQEMAEKKQLNLAKTYYQKAMKLMPSREERRRPQLALCLLLTKAEMHVEAAEEWQKFRRDYPEDSNRSVVMEPLAKAYISIGKLQEAQELAEKILKQNPEGTFNARGRILLGDIQFQKKNYDEAAKIYAAVALLIFDEELTPKALKKAEIAYRKAGNMEKANKMLLKLKNDWKKS